MMKASYKKPWRLLVDKEMSKGDLHKKSGFSSSAMTKLRKGEDVSMEALRIICIALHCNIADIVKFVPDSESAPAAIVLKNKSVYIQYSKEIKGNDESLTPL